MPFNNYTFRNFRKEWNLEDTFTSSNFPRCNGMKERQLASAKIFSKKTLKTTEDMQYGSLNIGTLLYRS